MTDQFAGHEIERHEYAGHIFVYVKPCPHCRRKVRLSPKTATVTENGETTATVAKFGDSPTFLRQSLFSAISYNVQH